MDKISQAAQLYTAYRGLKDSDKIVDEIKELTDETKKGLSETSGDGLNSNVIKLTDALRQTMLAKRGSVVADPVNAIPADNEIAAQATVADEVPRTLMDGIKHSFANLRRGFTLEGMFDIQGEGKGIIGSLVSGARTRRENAERGAQQEVSQSPSAQILPFPTTQPQAALTGSQEEVEAENLRMMEDQNETLNQIEENTRPLRDLGSQLEKMGATIAESTAAAAAAGGGGGGSLLGSISDFLLGRASRGKGGRGVPGKGTPGRGAPGTPKGGAPRAPGSAGIGGRATTMMRGAPIIGTLMAVGAGGYEAYSGWTEASAEESERLREIDQRVEAGQMTKEEGDALKREAVDLADVKQSEAVGGGIGTAAGALAGAKAGAMLGSIVPGAGTFVGGLVGGAIGGIAGSGVGQDIGRWGAKGWQAVRGFFGGEAEIPEEKTEQSKVTTEIEKTSFQLSEKQFLENDPENYKKFKAYEKERFEHHFKERQDKRESTSNSQRAYRDEVTDREFAREDARKEAVIKFKNEIEAAGAGKVNTTRTSTGGIASSSPEQPTTPSQNITPTAEEGAAPTPAVTQESPGILSRAASGIASAASSAWNWITGGSDEPTMSDTERLYREQHKQEIDTQLSGGIRWEEGQRLSDEDIKTMDFALQMDPSIKDQYGPAMMEQYETQKADPSGGVTPPANKYERAKQKVQAVKAKTKQGSGTVVQGNFYSSEGDIPLLLPENVQPARQPQSGEAVYQQSEMNAAAAQPSSASTAPAVVNAPQTTVVNNANYAAPKIARSPESSYQRYLTQRYAF
jgi:hypothetical protein